MTPFNSLSFWTLHHYLQVSLFFFHQPLYLLLLYWSLCILFCRIFFNSLNGSFVLC
jgi:hypothetical protein